MTEQLALFSLHSQTNGILPLWSKLLHPLRQYLITYRILILIVLKILLARQTDKWQKYLVVWLAKLMTHLIAVRFT